MVADIVTEYKESNNYEGFQLEMIRLFSVDIETTADEFAATGINPLTDKTFHEVTDFYKRKFTILEGFRNK